MNSSNVLAANNNAAWIRNIRVGKMIKKIKLCPSFFEKLGRDSQTGKTFSIALLDDLSLHVSSEEGIPLLFLSADWYLSSDIKLASF